MSEQKPKLLPLLALVVLLFGAVLPASIGYVFADDGNQGQGSNQGSDGEDEGSDGQDGTGSGDGDEDVELSASDIPPAVMTAALDALNPVTNPELVEAELDGNIYELKFKGSDHEYEVKVQWVDGQATVLETESEDEESHNPVSSDEDEDSHNISSSDNTIEFSKSTPEVKFKVKTEASPETELEFEAKFIGLVEFTPSGANSTVTLEGGEEVFSVDFDSISWTVTSENITSTGNSTTVTGIRVTYNASSNPEYTIKIQMDVPQSHGADIVKATIFITWNWHGDNPTSNLLALLSEVEAKFEAEGVELPAAVANVEGTMLAIEAGGNTIIQFTIESAITTNPDQGLTALVSAYTTKTETESETGTSEVEAEVKMEAVAVYPNFGASQLVHDPTIGFIDDPVTVKVIREAIQRVTGIPSLNITTLLYATLAITAVAIAFIAIGRRIGLNHAFPAAR